MKKAVAYARYSTDMQREESIDAQFRAIEDYCYRNDILLIHKYKDEGISGTSDERPEFQSMIDASDAHAFDYVVVHKLDRFTRSKYDSAIYKRRLKENGVRVLSVLENLDDSPESLILESVLEGMSEYYSRNLSREVKKGMSENAYKGKFNGGTPPLGYDIDHAGDYIINEWEARAIRIIFDMYGDGHSYNDIIKKLNHDGYKTKKGRPFGKNSLYEILRNEKYIGNYIYRREDYDGFSKKRNNHAERDRKDMIVLEGKIPSIISKDAWEIVQMRREKNKHVGGGLKAKRTYILSGILVCDSCGEKMSGCMRRSSTGREYYYYRCTSNRKTDYCSSVNADKIETAVKKRFDRAIFTEHNKKIVAEAIEQYSRIYRDSDANKNKVDYNAELLTTTNQINRIVDAIANGASTPAMYEKLKDLENKKAALLSDMEKIISYEDQDKVLRKQIEDFLNSHSSIEDFSPEKQKTILSMFIESIVYRHSSIQIKMRMINPEILSNGNRDGAGKRT